MRTPPSRIVLEFNEQPEAHFAELVVIGPDGSSHWEAGPPSIVDNSVSAPLRELGPAGGYTIRYRVTSADGHPVSGSIPFTLTAAGTGVPASATVAPAAEPMPLWPWITGGAIFLVTGIAVALLGRNTAVGTFLAAVLFGALLNGTSTRNLDPTIFPPELAGNLTRIIQGLVVLFVGADLLVLYLWQLRRKLRIRRPPARIAPAASPE